MTDEEKKAVTEKFLGECWHHKNLHQRKEAGNE